MVKKKSVAKLKKELWRVFSIYIRMRDAGICFSCKKVIPDYYDRQGNVKPGWKAGQAGHFVTAANCGLALYFHEQNVHCQCHRCNVNLSGNWLEYERAMHDKYGKERTEEIKEMKYKEQVKWSAADYEEKIAYYKQKVKELENG